MRSLKSQYELIESLAAFSFGLIFTLLNFWQDNHLFFQTFQVILHAFNPQWKQNPNAPDVYLTKTDPKMNQITEIGSILKD